MSDFPTTIHLRGRTIALPIYLPDATFGVVRSVDAADLEACGVEVVVMNTFHLMQRPGSSTVGSLGGLHQMSGWNGPIVTDSGGFQAYSLFHQNPKFGKLTDRGITFKPEGAARSFNLTPEKCVQLQVAYDSDVVICLDDCTHVDAPLDEQRSAIERTIAWARRCKTEFQRLMEEKKLDETNRPRLFAVVQGGGGRDLRRRCAEALLEIGFDGYGYGGWPLDGDGNLLDDILGYVRELIPSQFPLHALGVGHPENVAASFELGYGIFDSAMPTHDACHNRVYAFRNPPDGPSAGLTGKKWFDFIYPQDDKHIKASDPISPYCDCPTCQHYSLGYLRHLFKLNDSLYPRLATIHNLRFMTQLTERLRALARSMLKMKKVDPQDLTPEMVAEAARAGSRYQNVDPGLVLSISTAELSKGRSFKEAVKAVRSRLHQVGSAYHTGKLGYAKWLKELKTLPPDLNDPALLDFCRRAMDQHASTSERLPYIEEFFHETLAPLGEIESVLDLACGLNPLAIPWMPLQVSAQYHACDIYSDMAAFLNRFLAHTGTAGNASVCNLVEAAPDTRVQLAFLLKSIPCLEHLDRNIGPRLLDTIPADNILVSFPARSLGGRSKGMVENYEARFESMLAGRNWQIHRFEFPTELAFLLTR